MGSTENDPAKVTGDPAARGGVYVLVDLENKKPFFVGRSVDVRRRLQWWHVQEGGGERFRGVVILQTDDVLLQRGAEQKALEQYGTLRPDSGDVPGRGGSDG